MERWRDGRIEGWRDGGMEGYGFLLVIKNLLVKDQLNLRVIQVQKRGCLS